VEKKDKELHRGVFGVRSRLKRKLCLPWGGEVRGHPMNVDRGGGHGIQKRMSGLRDELIDQAKEKEIYQLNTANKRGRREAWSPFKS